MGIDTIVGILALPRSGTTMFGAVFDAHPDAVTLYEPWNSDAEDVKSHVKSASEEPTVDRLVDEGLRINPGARVLVIKETATQPEYVIKLLALLDGARSNVSSQLILLLRNPIHCFLSEVEARRRWWGNPSTDVTAAFFLEWASSRLPVLREMATSIRLRGGIVTFYDTLVTQPENSFCRIMRVFGLPFYHGQLLIAQNADLSRTRGDRSLAEGARNVESVSIDKRRLNFYRHKDVFHGLSCYNSIIKIVENLEVYEKHLILMPSMADYDRFFLNFEEQLLLAQQSVKEDLSRIALSDDSFDGDHQGRDP